MALTHWKVPNDNVEPGAQINKIYNDVIVFLAKEFNFLIGNVKKFILLGTLFDNMNI